MIWDKLCDSLGFKNMTRTFYIILIHFYEMKDENWKFWYSLILRDLTNLDFIKLNLMMVLPEPKAC